jgi:hypothetical protein
MDIDIKPGSCDNPVNFKSRGIVPVAILLEEAIAPEEIREITVDVAYQPDPASPDTVLLLSLEPVRTSSCDISTPGLDCGTRARDGVKDVLFKFRTKDLVEALAEEGVTLLNGDQQEITLVFTATLADGITTMEGSDTILAMRPGIGQGQAAKRFNNRKTIRNNTGNNSCGDNGNNCVDTGINTQTNTRTEGNS